MIAVLFVDPKGVYSGLSGVDPWGEDRDARLYQGPYPVVAHPPCARWCRLAGLVEARWGHKKGDDGGLFASALESVRIFHGVLEHPAYSDAWKRYGIAKPPNKGGWVKADSFGGWTCQVEQGRYGHPARKATWLYAAGCELLDLRWGKTPYDDVRASVSWCGNRAWRGMDRPRIGKKAAAATPPEFRDVLIAMARSG